MTQSNEEWFDSNQSQRLAASAVLAASLGTNPGIPILPQQNRIDFTL